MLNQKFIEPNKVWMKFDYCRHISPRTSRTICVIFIGYGFLRLTFLSTKTENWRTLHCGQTNAIKNGHKEECGPPSFLMVLYISWTIKMAVGPHSPASNEAKFWHAMSGKNPFATMREGYSVPQQPYRKLYIGRNLKGTECSVVWGQFYHVVQYTKYKNGSALVFSVIKISDMLNIAASRWTVWRAANKVSFLMWNRTRLLRIWTEPCGK